MADEKRLYGETDIAKALGVTPQAVDNWWRQHERGGRLPEADWIGPRGTPFWLKETFDLIVERNKPLVEKNKSRGQISA